jgi:signal transduction histidine kinase
MHSMARTRATDASNSANDEGERRGTMVLRTLPILLIPVIAAMVTGMVVNLTVGPQIIPPDVPKPTLAAVPLAPVVALIVFCSALIILVRLGRPTISALMLIGVWTLATTVGAMINGITSIWPALLMIPICAAGLLLDRTATIMLALLASILICALGWMDWAGFVLPRPPRLLLEGGPRTVAIMGFWLGLFWCIAALTSLLAGSLHRALSQSRADAQALTELSQNLEMRVADQTAKLLDQSREAATLEERTRLARDIHDTLAQGLTGIVVQLGAAERALAVAPDEAEQHLDLARRMAREALAEARRSVWNLRSPLLERGDLSDALQSVVAHPLQGDTRATFEQHGTPWTLRPDVESALLRVCQEALVNVAKHASAQHVAVVLQWTPDAVSLHISDDGVGFDVAARLEHQDAVAPWQGFGLLGMRERITALGGTLRITSTLGVRVEAQIPRTHAALDGIEPTQSTSHASSDAKLQPEGVSR